MKTLKWFGNLFKGRKKQYDHIIHLRGRVQFSDKPEDFFRLFEQALADDTKEKKIKVELTSATFIYPEVLFFLICLKESIQGVVDIHFRSGSQLHEYLDYAGFCEQFKIEKFPSGQEKEIAGEIFPLQRMKKNFNENEISTKLVNLLKTEQAMSSSVEGDIIGSIEEVLGNISQHSGCSQSFLLGQAYPASNRIRFVLYDNGIGIKNHITEGGYSAKHPNFKKEVSKEVFDNIENSPSNLAIDVASKDFVSATNYTQNSGAGINHLIEELLPITEGKLSILSGDGIVAWKNGRNVYCNMKIPCELKGTLVSLTLSCEPGTIIVR